MSKFTKLTNIAPSQLPQFVREDYPTFIAFIKAYYEYLDNQKISRNIESLRDIDDTLTDFVKYLKQELAISAPALANDRFFLKNSKQSYIAKGSEQSYECLFRLLYNKNVQIEYPGEKVIKASGGEWVQDVSFFLTVTAGDVYDLANDYLYIYTTTTKGTVAHKHRVYVKRIQQVETTDNTYEVFISKNYYGDLNIGDTVDYKGVKGVIQKTTSNVSIVKAGSGFKVGQTFHIATSVSSGCYIKVTKTDSVGGITQIEKISFGLGYQKDFYFSLSDLGAVPFVPQTYALQKDETANWTDAGVINKLNYYSADAASGNYVGETLGEFYSNNPKADVEQNSAVIFVKLGAIARYPGYYKSSTSLISDDSYIHDGDYYQDFSYVLSIDEKLSAYQNAVYSCLHPVGRKLFGNYLIDAYYELNYEISNPVIRILIPQYSESNETVDVNTDELTYFLLSRNVTDSINTPLDAISTKGVSKSFHPDYGNHDSISTPTDASTKFTYKKLPSLEDIANNALTDNQKDYFVMADSGSDSVKNIGKALADTTVGFGEVNTISIDKPLTDGLSSPTDSAAKLTTKNFHPDYGNHDSISEPTDTISNKHFSKALADLTEIPTDAISTKGFVKSLADLTEVPTDSTVILTTKLLQDTTDGAIDSISSKSFGKALVDAFDQSDLLNYSFTKSLSTSFSIADDTVLNFGVNKLIADNFSSIDSISSISTDKALTDSIINTESGFLQLNPYSLEGFFAEEYQAGKTSF